MSTTPELTVVPSVDQPGAPCAVCGNAVPPGEGITALYRGGTLRFKCPGCLARFEADPLRFLAGSQESCCGRTHDTSPASEWRCD